MWSRSSFLCLGAVVAKKSKNQVHHLNLIKSLYFSTTTINLNNNNNSSRNVKNSLDGFGLDETDLEGYVQGLYTTMPKSTKLHEQQQQTQAQDYDDHHNNKSGVEETTNKQPQPPADKYSHWLTSPTEKKLSARSAADTELVHSALYGSIRLDKDNPPSQEATEFINHAELDETSSINRLEDEYDYQYKMNPKFPFESQAQQQQQQAQHQFPPPQPPNASPFKMPTIITSSDSGGKKKTSSSSSSSRKSGGTDTQEKGTSASLYSRIPSIYSPEPYHTMTHQDVWNLLSKQIIFENDYLLAINKPSGLPIHSPSRTCHHTLIDFLPEFAQIANTPKIYPLHRLDKETTGVLLLAKTEKAAIVLREKFASRSIAKKYLAIVKNVPEPLQGTIQIPIGDGEMHQGSSNNNVHRAVLKPDLAAYNLPSSAKSAKEAITHYKVIREGPHCSFVEISPETGIKHQIRVHFGLGIGCPILGDHKYSHRDKLAPQRLSPSVLKGLKMDQSKVRYLPLHLHCSNVKFTMPEGFITTDGNSNTNNSIFIHARPPVYFLRSSRALGLR